MNYIIRVILALYNAFQQCYTFTIGFQVVTSAGSVMVKAAIVAMSCDLPARAIVLNMKQFNGQHGCHLCEDEGATSVRNKLFRWWPCTSSSTLRSKESLVSNSVYATKHNVVVSYNVLCISITL